MSNRNRKIQKIDDRTKLRNTKSKRSKNLMKKSHELSILCDLDINVSIYNRRNNKLLEYCSNQEFTHEYIHSLINPKDTN